MNKVDFINRLGDLQKRINRLIQLHSDLKKENLELMTENTRITGDNECLRQTITELEAENRTISVSLSSAKDDLAGLQEQNSTMKTEYELATQKSMNAANEIKNLREQNNELKTTRHEPRENEFRDEQIEEIKKKINGIIEEVDNSISLLTK